MRGLVIATVFTMLAACDDAATRGATELLSADIPGVKGELPPRELLRACLAVSDGNALWKHDTIGEASLEEYLWFMGRRARPDSVRVGKKDDVTYALRLPSPNRPDMVIPLAFAMGGSERAQNCGPSTVEVKLKEAFAAAAASDFSLRDMPQAELDRQLGTMALESVQGLIEEMQRPEKAPAQ